MKQFLFSLLIILFFSSYIIAQGPGGGGFAKLPFTGTVIDSASGFPLEYATIALQKQADSSIASGGITDMEGHFYLEIPSKGRYFVTVNFIGYRTKTIKGIMPAEGATKVDLGTIAIAPDEEILDIVEVTAERSQVQLQLDKRVYTVGKDMSNAGGTATDVLENIPSVEVDIDGNVSLRGSGNVQILIDGKPSGFTSSADALRSLQADQIERVEVVTNPSARYDAQGEVGIINIVLKKDRKQGLNGSVSAHVGYPHNHGGSFNLNYRGGFFSVSAGYGISYRRRPGFGNDYQENYSNDTTTYYRSDSEHERGGLNNMVNLGTDFFWKDKNTFGVSGNYNIGKNNNTSLITYNDLDADGNVLLQTSRDDEETENRDNLEVNAHYERTFDKDGQLFSASTRYTIRGDVEASIINQIGDGTTLLQRVNNVEDSDSWISQMDYIHPVFKKGKFETGAKVQMRNIDNKYSVEQQDSTGWESLNDFTGSFLYSEDIYAGYAMLSQQVKRFSWQLGLRLEVSDISGNSHIDSSDFRKTYANLFPSAHLSYEINEKNTIQLSYSRRLSRPNFWQLIQFTSFTDSRNIRRGNPNINPEFTNAVELGYLRYWDKGSLLVNVYYRYRTNVVEYIRQPQPDGAVFSYPVNLAEQHNGGLEVSVNHNLFKWWSINASVNSYYFIQRGSYEGQNLDNQAFTTSARVTTKWNIPKDFSIQSSFRYHSPTKTAQGRTKYMATIDLAIAKDVLKGKGKLVLSGRDLFNSNVRRSFTDTDLLYQYSEHQWASRSIVLTFTYAFGQQKKGKQNNGGMNFGEGEE